MSRPAPLGAVLAGGLGRRLGRPKTLVRLAGRPLAAFALEATRGAGLDTVLVVKADTPVSGLDAEVVHDAEARRHPVAGVLAALARAGDRSVVVVGADMPLVTPALIRALAEVAPEAAAVVSEAGGRLHPLCARYAPAAREALEAALAAAAPLQRTVASLEPVHLDEAALRRFGDPAELLLNVNTPDDLARAEAVLRRRATSGPAA